MWKACKGGLADAEVIRNMAQEETGPADSKAEKKRRQKARKKAAAAAAREVRCL